MLPAGTLHALLLGRVASAASPRIGQLGLKLLF
jgi:hypothetical protein